MSYWNDSRDSYATSYSVTLRNWTQILEWNHPGETLTYTRFYQLLRNTNADFSNCGVDYSNYLEKRNAPDIYRNTQMLIEKSKTWRDFVDVTHEGDNYSYSEFFELTRSLHNPGQCFQEYLSSRSLLSPDPDVVSEGLELSQQIKAELDFKKRVPLYFELLLQDEEFSSIYCRMSADSKQIYIDKDTKRQVIVKDYYHPFIEHCLVHYAYVFMDINPFSNEQFFYFLRNKLYAEKSSEELLQEMLEKKSNFLWKILTSPASPMQVVFLTVMFVVSFFQLFWKGTKSLFSFFSDYVPFDEQHLIYPDDD